MDEEQKKRALLTIFGGVLVFVGYYLPWYSLAFAPPSGYTIVDGQEIDAFTYAYSGLNGANTTTDTLLHPTILALLLIGSFDLVKLILPEGSATQAVHYTAQFFHSKITGGFVDFIQALAHVVVSLLWILFCCTYVGLGKVAIPTIYANDWGGDSDAFRASHYLTVHFGIGLILMLVGLILSGIAILRKVGIVAGILLLVLVVLFCTHSSYLAPFIHYLGF